MSDYPRIATLRAPEKFRARLKELELPIDLEDTIETAPDSPLAQPMEVDGFNVGNRFVIHPMEGWDAEPDGRPSELVERRWRNFGRSGAKWIWGGEAMAVVPEGRANPNQLIINEANADGLKRLLAGLLETHAEEVGSTDDLLVGFQLTHSGRFCRPFRKDKAEPQILYRHPVLDRKLGLGEDYPLLSDDEIRKLIDTFVAAAGIAERCGAQFVDVKHCHGYLGHEFLSAFTRPGPFGGAFENRTRFLREITAGIQATTKLKIGVRVSAFDFTPYKPDPDQSEGSKLGPGVPEDGPRPYESGFAVNHDDPTSYNLKETGPLLELFESLGIRMVNVTAGSPYYNPHIQRPALFPPSDGYQPPEDPLVGCARQIDATAKLKQAFPNLVMVGSAYSYMQELLPHVAQWAVRNGKVDAVGLGRMVLSYPDMPADILGEGKLTAKKICRTFSDCTTGPRKGMISGCYPLDPFYKARPEAAVVKKIKASL